MRRKMTTYRPMANALTAPKSYQWDAPSLALKAWAERDVSPQAASDPSVIDIYDVIGEDPWTGEGFTERKLAAILRDLGANPVTLNINSPGGDMFAGLAMYNRLKAHKADVIVNVMGVAASAASLIAMAGTTVNMMTGSVLMIHNAWGMVIGNRHDFKDAAAVFETFDASMAEIYSARTGISTEEIMSMMDGDSDGTFLTAKDAIDRGFADAEVGTKPQASLPADVLARRKIEASLARDGLTRKQRHEYIMNLIGKREAAGNVVQRDADEVVAALNSLKETFTRS